MIASFLDLGAFPQDWGCMEAKFIMMLSDSMWVFVKIKVPFRVP